MSSNASNSISAGALPQTSLGELTALPRPVFKEPTSKGRGGRGEGGKGRERDGKEGEEWEGDSFGP